MATSKTAKASSGKKTTQSAPLCPNAKGPDERLVRVLKTGFGDRGFYWICDKACGFQTRNLRKD